MTEQEADILKAADEAALVPVVSPDLEGSTDAPQVIASNPGLVNALESDGFGIQQVIAADQRGDVPTVYVEVEPAN